MCEWGLCGGSRPKGEWPQLIVGDSSDGDSPGDRLGDSAGDRPGDREDGDCRWASGDMGKLPVKPEFRRMLLNGLMLPAQSKQRLAQALLSTDGKTL